MHFNIKIFYILESHANRGKDLDDFKIATFIGHFQNDGSERVKAQTCIEAHAHSHTPTHSVKHSHTHAHTQTHSTKSSGHAD